MAKIYLTGDYSEDGGTYALQIIADLLISKGHKVTFPAQYRVSCTQKEEENLQVLCPNHHAMTEHFGSRNKNSTRRYRYSKRK